MRARTVMAAALLAAGAFSPTALWAQGNPSADQIIRSLTPTAGTPATTRGIRAVPQSPNAAAPERTPSVNLNVDFQTGSAELTPQARTALDQLGQALTSAQLSAYRFRVEGHTDTVGGVGMNQVLSERRAASVVGYLESKYAINPSRLHAIGMGEKGLLVPTPDNTPELRNRRVLVVNVGS